MLTWTDDMVEDLKAGINIRLSASSIARGLNKKHGINITRNSVIGKAYRMKLQFYRSEGETDKSIEKKIESARLKKASKPPKRKYSKEVLPPMEEKPAVTYEEKEKVYSGCRPVTFSDLNNNNCKYIISEQNQDVIFCGAQRKSESSYCEYHHKLCHSARGAT